MDARRNRFEYEDLLACGRGEMFGPGNAQLPLPPMLMFDRISEISEQGGEHGKGLVRAELEIKPDLWFFGCHFKNDPVMPGCLGLDAMWQMVGFYLGWIGGEGRATVSDVRLNGLPWLRSAARCSALGLKPVPTPADGTAPEIHSRTGMSRACSAANSSP